MEVGFPRLLPGDFQSGADHSPPHQEQPGLRPGSRPAKTSTPPARPLKVAEAFRIHTFISTSSIHVESKAEEELRRRAGDGVGAIKHALRYTDDVEFSCEDAGRTPIDNLCRMVEAAIKAGARTINIPDTVGYTVPTGIFRHHPQFCSTGCRTSTRPSSRCTADDLGPLGGELHRRRADGARQIEVHHQRHRRAGGQLLPLEEVAMILKTRADLLGVHPTSATTRSTAPALVSQLCNMPVQPTRRSSGPTPSPTAPASIRMGCSRQRTPTKSSPREHRPHPEQPQHDLPLRSPRDQAPDGVHGLRREQLRPRRSLRQVPGAGGTRRARYSTTTSRPSPSSARSTRSPEHFKLEYLGVQSGSSVLATASVKLKVGQDLV